MGFLQRTVEVFAKAIDKYPYEFLLVNVVIVLSVQVAYKPSELIALLVSGTIAFTTTTVVVILLKMYIGEKRWEIKSIQDYRNPSYHSAVASTMCIVGIMYQPFLIAWFMIYMYMTAIGRVYIGKHKWNEVYNGTVVGMMIGVVAVIIVQLAV